MSHDVFISYSSKNSATAQAICHELEDNHIKCWMAPRDIPVGAKYASVIAQAIKSSKAVVLVFSEQSAISPWVESEINIAFSNRKPIVPYKIDAVALESYDEFYLMLNNRHWIESYPDFKTRFAELVEVVARIVGVDLAPKNKDVAPKDNEAKSKKSKAAMPSPAKTYKVGDYYNDGTKEGVVFWVDESGKHGKIVSLDQEQRKWCDFTLCDKKTEALSLFDGEINTRKILTLSECAGFPAFVWCRSLGEDWYLPAIEEVELLISNSAIVNCTLENRNQIKLFTWHERKWYWSSTEYERIIISAWSKEVGMESACCNKYAIGYVRAVAQF